MQQKINHDGEQLVVDYDIICGDLVITGVSRDGQNVFDEFTDEDLAAMETEVAEARKADKAEQRSRRYADDSLYN